jgi:ABC-type nickel/cobalt efflux system permease component RcnA
VFGLDDMIANLSDGATFGIVMAVAVLLGLRHATDPDHLAAVTAVAAGSRDQGGRQSARLGIAWGSGHALTLFVFGLPIVLFAAYLPATMQQGAEALVGLVIIGLAVWLLARWRRGCFDPASEQRSDARTPRQAFGVGLLHGIGGSAGVGAILLATIDNRALAVGGLVVLAAFTAVSMTVLTTGFGATLARRPVQQSLTRVIPVLGVASLAFGAWYALGALELAPYYF